MAPANDADRTLVDDLWKARRKRVITDAEKRQLYAALRRAWLVMESKS